MSDHYSLAFWSQGQDTDAHTTAWLDGCQGNGEHTLEMTVPPFVPLIPPKVLKNA
jgi:hypothetical protein